MIKTSMKEIIKAQSAFKTILNCNLPAVSAMTAKRLLKLVLAEVENYEEARHGLIKKYGKETKPGQFSIAESDTEAIKLFQDEMTPILEHDIELQADPIHISVFEKAEISPMVLIDLEKFVTDTNP